MAPPSVPRASVAGGGPTIEEASMTLIAAFHTSSDEDGDKLVYHNQSECGYAKEIIRNGNVVPNDIAGRTLCERCRDLA